MAVFFLESLSRQISSSCVKLNIYSTTVAKSDIDYIIVNIFIK